MGKEACDVDDNTRTVSAMTVIHAGQAPRSANCSGRFADNVPHIAAYHVFFGPEMEAPESFTDEYKRINASVVPVDTLLSPELHDVLQDHIWSSLKLEVQNRADAMMISPPWGSFSGVREEGYGGPRPLRGPAGKDIHGVSYLNSYMNEGVRLGTARILKCVDRGPL